MSAIQSSPQGLCAYITVAGAAEAIEFYVRAFGAVVELQLVDPSDQRIGHAELRFGSSRIFVSDEYPDFGAVGPETIGGSPVKMHLEVADADAFVAKAVEQGATVLRAVKKEFHGDRTGMVADPYGYSWFVASKAEDVSAEEMQERWNDMTGDGA